jgi:hypothetical protein
VTRSLTDERSTERWLRRRGLPHLIPNYSSAEDSLSRAVPLLSLIFLAEVFAVMREDRRGVAEAVVVAGAAVLMVVAVAVVNLAQHRPPLSLPTRVGVPELSLFVVVPAALPLLFNDLDWSGAAWIAGRQIVAVVVIVVVADFALLPMLGWAAGQSTRTLRQVSQLAARTLPLLLLLATAIFFAGELWQVAAAFDRWRFWATIALLAAVGSMFILSGVSRRRSELGSFTGWAEVDAACERAGFDLRGASTPEGSSSRQLGGRAGVNVVLVLFAAVGLQILAVTLAVSLFYVVFGLLTVPDALAQEWIGQEPEPLSSVLPGSLAELPVLGWVGRSLSIELLRAALFVGTFGGLQVAISATTDETYRADFLGQVTADVREAVAVSLRLRALHGRSETAVESPQEPR